MFSLTFEDTEATNIANFNDQIRNFRSLKKNRETFLKLVPGSRTYCTTNWRTWCYTGEFVEQQGSNYQTKEGVNYFQSKT